MRNKLLFHGNKCWLPVFCLCIIISLPSYGFELFSSKGQKESQPGNPGDLNIKPGRKKVATIYTFRSRVPGISSSAATDMFTTALVKTGAFAVAERQRINAGFERERQLKANKKATGKSKGIMLTGADYIFEGTVSEVNATESEDETSFSLRGMTVDRSVKAGSIGLDVRVIEANTGKVVEAVNVRKQIESSGSGVSGFGSVISSLAGRGSSMTPDVNIKRARKDGLDKAVRECIEEAVCKIAERLSSD